MFSSNQIFKVSCDDRQLETALRTAIVMHEVSSSSVDKYLEKAVFQTTETGKFALGWCGTEPADGWNKFPLGAPSMEMILAMVRKFCKDHPVKGDHFWDGTYSQGFLIKAISENMGIENNDGVKSPFYGVVTVESFENFYSK